MMHTHVVIKYDLCIRKSYAYVCVRVYAYVCVCACVCACMCVYFCVCVQGTFLKFIVAI